MVKSDAIEGGKDAWLEQPTTITEKEKKNRIPAPSCRRWALFTVFRSLSLPFTRTVLA